jgi:hypothetical protein
MGLGPFVNYQPPGVYGPAVPPILVTKESAFATLSVCALHWNKVYDVSCFRLRWDEKDCFFFAPADGIPYPMTTGTLMEHAYLVLAVSDRKVLKNRYFDEDGKVLFEAFEAHLDVEHVHAL